MGRAMLRAVLIFALSAGNAWPADTGMAARIAAIEHLGWAQPGAAADEAAQWLPQTAAFSAERLELLTLRGLMLASSRRIVEARDLARSFDDWARTGQAREAAAAALLVRARIENEAGKMQTADALLDEARAHPVPGMSPKSRLRFIAAQGWVKKEEGQIEPAMRLFQEGSDIADELLLPDWQVDMRCGLARVAVKAGQLERAERLNREALAIATRNDDDFLLYRVHSTEGILLDDGTKDHEGMRREFEAALVNARRAKAASAESLTLSNLSDVYLQRGDFKTALAMAEQALPLTRRLGDRDGEMVALFNAGIALISTHNLDLGKRYVAESIAIDERRGAFTSMSESYLELGEYLEKAGDAAGAVAAFHRYRTLADDIVQRDQQKVLIELQQSFEAERRTRDLALLNRENQIKSEQLHRQGLQQDLWWLLAGSSLLSLAALLGLYRRVRRTNHLLVASNRELSLQSERDPLTGLANRRHFQAVMAAEPTVFEASVLLLDIDHFKAVNDRHGHSAGDSVLVEVAERLRATLRADDLIVRWGGEEFLIVARERSADGVDALSEKLLGVLADTPFAVPGRHITVTASIGYASFPIRPERLPVSVERAIKLADSALYLAKARGRNRACGVARLQVPDGAAFDLAAGSLEATERAGRATLISRPGPATVKVAA
jgi:diguanylate cyclase (GGDEF)-like protein